MLNPAATHAILAADHIPMSALPFKHDRFVITPMIKCNAFCRYWAVPGRKLKVLKPEPLKYKEKEEGRLSVLNKSVDLAEAVFV